MAGRFVTESESSSGKSTAAKLGDPSPNPVLLLMPSEAGIRQVSAASQPDGTFILNELGLDRYHATFRGVPDNLYVKSVKLGEGDATEAGLDFRAGRPTGSIEITLGSDGAVLDGVVQDDSGAPSKGYVALIPDTILGGHTERLKSTSADETGHFKIQGIAPGNYKIYAWEDINSAVYRDPAFASPLTSRKEYK